MEKVVITGGSGFIGTNLAEYFIAQNCHPHIVTAINGSSWRIKNYLDKGKVSVYPIGLEDKSKLNGVIRKINPDIIFHLASFGVSKVTADEKTMESVNIGGTRNILEASRRLNLKAFVYTGTCFEYANKENRLITENLQTKAFNFYGQTKQEGTELCQEYSRKYSLPAIIIRPFTAYGPWEDKSRFIAKTILSVLQNKPPEVIADDPLRNFVYVGDIVNGLIKAKDIAKNYGGEIINLGWDQEYRVSFVAKTICSLTGAEFSPKLIDKPKYAADNYHWAIDNSKAARLLHWKPQITLEEGFKRTIEWYKKLFDYQPVFQNQRIQPGICKSV